MKQFFEQYGGVALGILALLVLIAIITPVGNIIKTSLQGTTETFSTRIESQTDTMTVQMQEAFEEASTERYYDDTGNRLNGIIDRTLYVDGVAYRNLWDPYQNQEIAKSGITEFRTTNSGYMLTATNNDPYIGEVSSSYYNHKYNKIHGQKYYLHEGYDYIFVTNNLPKNYFVEWDENGNNLLQIYNYPGGGTVSYLPYSYKTRVTPNAIRSNASYLTTRIGLGTASVVGQTYEFEIMVFEVPSNLEIDLSSL